MEMVTEKCTRTTFLLVETQMEMCTWKASLRIAPCNSVKIKECVTVSEMLEDEGLDNPSKSST